MQKKVLITGVTGQDGSYMAEFCLALGHTVYGMARLTSTLNDVNFKHLYPNPNFHIVRGDLLDSHSLETLLREIQPDYFINLAAQSFVGDSWKIPEETFMADAIGVLKCLEALKKYSPMCRFYNAGSSEQFGDVSYSPQDEKHPFRPRSPYGAAKCAAHYLVKVYRESYNLYAVQGLLFNHESERRGKQFVTRKITQGFGRITKSLQNRQTFEPVMLGNIYSQRDWSHAKDFVEGIWRMLNQEVYNEELNSKEFEEFPEIYNEFENKTQMHHWRSKNLKEYVLASGETHTIKDFATIAAKKAGFEATWIGEGVNEKLILVDYIQDIVDIKSNVLIAIDPQFYRPAEVDLLLGDSSLVKKDLGWNPKISFDKLVELMVASDVNEQTIK